jgi:hypothetical protein
MSFVRLEPLTGFLCRTLTLLLMAIMASTFSGGRWLGYGLSDYLVKFSTLGGSALISEAVHLSRTSNEEKDSGQRSFNWRKLLPVLRGLLLAVPVLAMFASLLASADPIFARNLKHFFDIFRIEDLDEFIFRLSYILILAYLLSGVYIHLLLKSGDEKLLGEDKPWLTPFLGFTESGIVLGSVDVLFLAFVFVQFRYFFGGQANIAMQGFTYSEYARRGFGELVVVALFSLFLFLGLSAITKRASGRQQKTFSALGIALVLLVGVILVSAFQRLFLYENAYGFTRLRTYTHVFIVWLGLLLLAVVLLELLGRTRAFALAALLASLGFAASLSIINVDAFIARQNIARSRVGWELDIPYLASLSLDVVPTLSELSARTSSSGESPHTGSNHTAAALACHAALNQDYHYDYSWKSFHFSRIWAASTWGEHRQIPHLQGSFARQDENDEWYVLLDGEEQPCVDYYYRYD